MSAKITAARRAKFLHFLAASGNLTLSAERGQGFAVLGWPAPVDRPGVRRGVRGGAWGGEGCTFSKQEPTLGPSLNRTGGNGPPVGWGFLDGVKLVVGGSGGSGGGISGRAVKSWRQRPRTLDEVRASILRKLESIESWSAAGDEQLAADQHGYAARG